MIEQLIKDWQDALANETDTRKYRLIMLTIAFLQSLPSNPIFSKTDGKLSGSQDK